MNDSPAKELLDRTAAALAGQRRFPTATYRLQFHAGFTFRHALRIAPYLHDLGITDCYASPFLKARPGSKHGYDICDHRQLNPEIGNEEDYNAWVAALHERGMGQVLDMVPNHMGISGGENVWWNDVLENGPSSPYAGWFDINWQSHKEGLRNKVLLPVLGDPYGKVLEAGQLRLAYEEGGLFVRYYDNRFPVAPCTYGQVLGRRIEELEKALGADSPAYSEYQSILTAIAHLPPMTMTDPEKMAERHREKEVIKRRLAKLAASEPAVRRFVEESIAAFNGTPGEPHSFDPLDQLLDAQPYRLSFWRVASDEINYRRFFDINELAALSMERPEVFAATHELVLRLLGEGKVNGLRIDHPDGLFDPKAYLERLQESFFVEIAHRVFESVEKWRGRDWKEVEGALKEGLRQARSRPDGDLFRRPLYVVVEKILGKGEPVPEDWPVYGTTGYEFLNAVNGLFVEHANAAALTRIWHRWADLDPSFRQHVYEKKFLILQVALSSELHMLAHQLDHLSEQNRWSRDFTLNSLRHALREIIACFPVYRSYITNESVSPRDRFYVETAVARAKRRNPAISASIFDFVRDTLLLKGPAVAGDGHRDELRCFVGKFQQVTAPVMAKGVEDTAFYVYNRLVSLNEVGGDPEEFGTSVSAFHRHNADRQQRWPYALSSTATHDTKRGEDTRARLDVLSEMPRAWQQAVSRWMRFNKRFRSQLEDTEAPDRNDEYLIYQTLAGAWPPEPCGPEEFGEFVERIQQYAQKAIHEAKVHTSWINPDPTYDEAVRKFVAGVLDDRANGRFLEDMRGFQRRLAPLGLFNSLAQLVLKIASPGVPDIYQGTELWDFSLVDPDNRRPVDYERRQRLLGELTARLANGPTPELARDLLAALPDGRTKLYVTWQALHCRRERPGLFTEGDYLPADAVGKRRENVCAFVRRQGKDAAIVAVPRLVAGLLEGQEGAPVGAVVWTDTILLLPSLRPGAAFRNLFTGEVLTLAERTSQASLPLAEALAAFPVALLLAQD